VSILVLFKGSAWKNQEIHDDGSKMAAVQERHMTSTAPVADLKEQNFWRIIYPISFVVIAWIF